MKTHKNCTYCHNSKEIKEFRLIKDWRVGRKNYQYRLGKCRECISKIHHKWYLKNQIRLCRKAKINKINNSEKYLWITARRRAKSKNLEFDIEESDIIIPEFCPVLGIELCKNNSKISDNSPSLDRINPKIGYIKGNVKVISWKANRAKSDSTLVELEKIIEYVKKYIK